jgi:hypothetical protein
VLAVTVQRPPGDVESERAYEDQLQRLLRAAARPGARPARLFVLTDSPQRVRLPEGLTAEVRPGTRLAFTALGREVAGSPGPLVVVLWGHGGAQGTKPVFHVRGPRVDVADVTNFAKAAGPRPSRWILYFRGSGAFAEALGGPARVLSSERAVAFRSDPIGMDLLVRALAERPAALVHRPGRTRGPRDGLLVREAGAGPHRRADPLVGRTRGAWPW